MSMDGSNMTNRDCERCCCKTMIEDGGGDYEEIVPYCGRFNARLFYKTVDNKPCKLKPGSYYIVLEVNDDED